MNSRHLLKPLLWSLGLVLLAASIVGAGWAFHGSDSEHPLATTAPAAGFPEVVCFGHVDLEHGITSLCPAQPGRVAEVLVHDGDEVAAGSILIRLEDDLPRARVKEAAAAVKAAATQVAKARTAALQHQAKIAQLEALIEALKYRQSAAEHLCKVKQDMLKLKLISANEADIATDTARETEALLRAEMQKLTELRLHDPALEVRRAEAELALTQARLDQARAIQDQCVVKAPTAGTVLRMLVNPGELWGVAAKTPAVQFCPHGPRLIRAEVAQEFAGSLAIGQPATIRDDYKTGASWSGKLLRISNWYSQRRSIFQEPLQVNDVRTLECLLALDAGQAPLRIGQRVRVTLRSSSRP